MSIDVTIYKEMYKTHDTEDTFYDYEKAMKYLTFIWRNVTSYL